MSSSRGRGQLKRRATFQHLDDRSRDRCGAALKEIAKAWTSINAEYNRTTAAALR
jgi:hypothetical protein